MTTLTDKHMDYERDCRQMFVGQKIYEVIYGEVKYYSDDEGNNVNPEPSYKTTFPDIDTLDHSIYFKIDNKTIYIFWDNTFISYGLLSKLIDFDETTNNYEQKWNVSDNEIWKPIIGQIITDFKIRWTETWSSNLDGTNKIFTTYPQTIELTTESRNTILICASEFCRNESDEVYSMMDNLLVTTNKKLAKTLKLIGHEELEPDKSKTTILRKIFG